MMSWRSSLRDDEMFLTTNVKEGNISGVVIKFFVLIRCWICFRGNWIILQLRWNTGVVTEGLPAGQYADHVVGLVALDADGAVVKVGLRLLVALPDGAHLQLADGLLRCVAESALEKRDDRRI